MSQQPHITIDKQFHTTIDEHLQVVDELKLRNAYLDIWMEVIHLPFSLLGLNETCLSLIIMLCISCSDCL